MKVWIIFSGCIIFFCSCTGNNTEKNGQIKTRQSVIDSVLNLADSIDVLISKNEVSVLKLKYPSDTSKSLILYFTKKKALKLICPNYGVGGIIDSPCHFYFDKNGSLFLKTASSSNTDNSMQRIYLDLTKHIIYENIQRNMRTLKETNQLSDGIECDLIKEVDYLMQFF